MISVAILSYFSVYRGIFLFKLQGVAQIISLKI